MIAIDGPAGSGKSTTARTVAQQLGFQFLDTGAMYRALTWHAICHKIDPGDSEQLTRIAEKMVLRFEARDDINHVFLNDSEVTEQIRYPEVTLHVSEVSAHKGVRSAMVAKQQEIGRKASIVAEGRDTTTVVFPNAALKVYLDASVEVRAMRRLKELSEKGIESTLEAQMADIERRDHFDSNREHSPLTRSEDSEVIDTSNLSIEGQVAQIVRLAKSSGLA
ncbi:MAG: (d)CMP kinase [candidate division Zixibacteria bacterium]